MAAGSALRFGIDRGSGLAASCPTWPVRYGWSCVSGPAGPVRFVAPLVTKLGGRQTRERLGRGLPGQCFSSFNLRPGSGVGASFAARGFAPGTGVPGCIVHALSAACLSGVGGAGRTLGADANCRSVAAQLVGRTGSRSSSPNSILKVTVPSADAHDIAPRRFTWTGLLRDIVRLTNGSASRLCSASCSEQRSRSGLPRGLPGYG